LVHHLPISPRDQTRQCTFDYQILDGNTVTGVYQRVQRNPIELYTVDKDSGVAICSGCSEFCDKDVSACYKLNSWVSVDAGKWAYISCLDGYYFDSTFEQCSSCISNCLKCTTSSDCSTCKDSYIRQQDGKTLKYTCTSCSSIANCEKCELSGTIIRCTSCELDSYGYPRIPALNQRTCVSCGSFCSRCEYTTYTNVHNPNFKYPTRYTFYNA
jgi:hypothetical protein